jgi:hypothetical protein
MQEGLLGEGPKLEQRSGRGVELTRHREGERSEQHVQKP